jgi:TRAP-type uncharacterized transport system substrate-binding protein
MRNTILLLITMTVTMIGLTACAAVFTDASDSNHVTFINSADESLSQLTEKANSYCQQYGKKAVYRKGDNLLVAVFDCR